jgi:hypothetical protein
LEVSVIINLWRKFHFIAEILCHGNDKRELLKKAAHEIDTIDPVYMKGRNIPQKYIEQVCRIKEILSLPQNVCILKNVPVSNFVIQNLTEEEADNLVRMIFELESNLNPNNFLGDSHLHILE